MKTPNNNLLKLMALMKIKNGDNIDSLVNIGCSYSKIAHMFSDLYNDKLITYGNSGLILSEDGEHEIEVLSHAIKEKKLFCICSYDKYKIDKLDKYDIFIE